MDTELLWLDGLEVFINVKLASIDGNFLYLVYMYCLIILQSIYVDRHDLCLRFQKNHVLNFLDVHSKLEPDLSTYQPTSRCRCRLAKNLLNISVQPSGGICRQKRNPWGQEIWWLCRSKEHRPIRASNSKLGYLCLSLKLHGFGKCRWNREHPKLPVHTLRKANITMEKDPLKIYFLLNMGIFHLYLSFPRGYPTYCQRIMKGQFTETHI